MLAARILAGRINYAQLTEIEDPKERDRLRKIIMNPAMVLTWLFGVLMLVANWDYLIAQPWIHIKLTAVILMSGMHGWLIGLGKKVRAGDADVSEKALRLLNELPFVLAIIGVVAVVVQPFAR